MTAVQMLQLDEEIVTDFRAALVSTFIFARNGEHNMKQLMTSAMQKLLYCIYVQL